MTKYRNDLQARLLALMARARPADCPGVCHVARARPQPPVPGALDAARDNVIPFPLARRWWAGKKGGIGRECAATRPLPPVAAVLALALIVGAAAWAPGQALVLGWGTPTPPVHIALSTVASAATTGLTKYRQAECAPEIPGTTIHTTNRLDPCSLPVGEDGYQVM